MMDPMGTDPKERLLRLLEMAYEQYAITPPMPMPDMVDPMMGPESPMDVETKGTMLRDKLSADVEKKAPKKEPKADKADKPKPDEKKAPKKDK